MQNHVDIFSRAYDLYNYLINHTYNSEFFFQALTVAFAAFLSFRLASFANRIPEHESVLILKLKNNRVMSFYEICFYLFFFILIGILEPIFAALEIDSILLTSASIALAIWIVTRLTFNLGRHSPEARFIALALWAVGLFTFFSAQSAALEFLRNVSFNIGKLEFNLLFIIEIIITFSFLLWLAHYLSYIAKREIDASDSLSISQKVLYKELTLFGLYVVAVATGLISLGIDLTLLTVFSGTLGFGIGIGVSRIIANFIAGIVLLLDKSIKPGDLLLIDGKRGTVNHMHPRYVTVITRDGGNILVPNESLINEKVHNLSYASTYMQMQISLLVTYGNDMNYVKQVVDEVLKVAPDILESPPATCHVSELTEDCIKYEVKYWISDSVKHPGAIQHDLLVLITDALKKNKIQLYTRENQASIKAEDVTSGAPPMKKSSKKKPAKK